MSAPEPESASTARFPCETSRWPLPSFEELKVRAKALGYSTDDFLVLVQANDPYAAGRPHRQRAAVWFAAVIDTLGIPVGWHLRRIHYVLVSRPDIVPWPDGRRYQNTLRDWVGLVHAARDAAALSLVPPDILSDARNDAPFLNSETISFVPTIETDQGMVGYHPMHVPPKLRVRPWVQSNLPPPKPTIARPFVVEIWVEKTTVNDVVIPLAREYGLNIVTASGEISATACRQLVDRAMRQRPTRILYVSDFDPAGRSIPVAMARKVEYEIDRRHLDLDIQVRPVVLTHQQCVNYALPRAPIKETERRGAKFEERFGEGATELDALEALHPGALRRILVAEIERDWNADHDDEVNDAWADFQAELQEINVEVAAEFKDEFEALEKQRQRLEKSTAKMAKIARDLFARMHKRLEQRKPAFVPPEIAFEADEDPNPLFDSRRSYLDQLAVYKEFQGKAAPGLTG
jgi:hypothetical protein